VDYRYSILFSESMLILNEMLFTDHHWYHTST